MPRVTKEKETKSKTKRNYEEIGKHNKEDVNKKKNKNKTEKNKINKNKRKSNTSENIKQEKDNNQFSFDDEIVIGLKRLDEPQVENPKSRKKTKKKQNTKKESKRNREEASINRAKGDQKSNKAKNSKRASTNKQELEEHETEIIIKSKYMQNYEEEEQRQKEKSNKNNKRKPVKRKTKEEERKEAIARKRRKRIFKIIKWLMLIAIIIGGIIFAMLSPIFNITNIEVVGNTKISSDTIISLSGLNINQNIFNFRTSDVVENIKQNAYIDKVEIDRNLPDELKITVTERESTYMFTFGNAYVYINNQGYLLEITSEKGNFPMITGYQTPEEQIIEGNRLCTEDLQRLEDVLRIMEAARSVDGGVDKLITQIDISDKSNYILTLEKEKKQVYLGDASNLGTKMLWINKLLEEEKDNEGIIFINVDLINSEPYFRRKV